MHRGAVAYIIIILVIIAITYFETQFNFSHVNPGVIHGSSTVAATSTSNTTTIPSNIYNYSNSVVPCNAMSLATNVLNATVIGSCQSAGNSLGLWVAAGDSGSETLTITGKNDSITYLNQTASYDCITFYRNLTLPAQTYILTLKSGNGGSTCGQTIIKLNQTAVAPVKTYATLYNGDFSSGAYSGWSTTGTGFGPAPLNIQYADEKNCYIGQPWAGYDGSFFATTFNCGLATTFGNLTSSPFYVNVSKPFLNFKIISPSSQQLSVDILENGQPVVIMHYNTFNSSLGTNASSTFRNASIPLSFYEGKVVQIRVVAQTLSSLKYIAVGDFALSSNPIQTTGIVANRTVLT